MRGRRRRPPRALLRTFAAVAEAVLPEDGAFAGAVSAGCAPALERAWPDLQPAARRGLAAMLLTVEVAALLHTGRRLAALPRRAGPSSATVSSTAPACPGARPSQG